jgi:hypothetical protein
VFEALHDKDATGYWSHGIAEDRTIDAPDGTACCSGASRTRPTSRPASRPW